MANWTTVVNEPRNLERSELGRVVHGTYGKEFTVNEEGEEVKVADHRPRLVKGRGRPLKDDNGTGTIYVFSEELMCIQTMWS